MAAGLIDTNIAILLPRLRDDELLPNPAKVSVVTLAELSVGPLVATDEDERGRRAAVLRMVEAEFDLLPFDEVAARTFGAVSAALRSAGRKTSARSFDAMIAATALVHDLPLFTANPVDFEAIPGLQIVPVSVPSAG